MDEKEFKEKIFDFYNKGVDLTHIKNILRLLLNNKEISEFNYDTFLKFHEIWFIEWKNIELKKV